MKWNYFSEPTEEDLYLVTVTPTTADIEDEVFYLTDSDMYYLDESGNGRIGWDKFGKDGACKADKVIAWAPMPKPAPFLSKNVEWDDD